MILFGKCAPPAIISIIMRQYIATAQRTKSRDNRERQHVCEIKAAANTIITHGQTAWQLFYEKNPNDVSTESNDESAAFF
jgi:hypothetical protein